MKRQIYQVYSRTALSAASWKLFGSGLRILTYHGVCPDELADKAWVPSYFVKKSCLEEQLQYLVTHTHLISLREAVVLLKVGGLPERATAVTFDDGYANNLDIALPLLQKYRIPTTIFLATGHTRSGELLPFDRVRLIRLYQTGNANDREFYRMPIGDLNKMLQAPWGEIRPSLPATLLAALRPLTLDELKYFPSDLIEFGAHTRSHCILCNETGERRRAEIQDSLEDISNWTGNPAPLFSYPTGAFNATDKQMLVGRCQAAVTTEPGKNEPGADVFALKRYSVAMNHTFDGFVAEVTGLRTLLNRFRRSVTRRSHISTSKLSLMYRS